VYFDESKTMILSNDTLQDIPRLLDPGWMPAPSQAKEFWKYLQRWRITLFHRWSQEGCEDIPSKNLGQLVDHLLGASLLLCYVKRWKKASIPSLQDFYAGLPSTSLGDLSASIQTFFTCPILQGVFDPAWIPANTSIPPALFVSDWENRVANALWLLFRDHPLPLSLFGDFHQFCVANPR
jgi:hypothetical protein